MSRLQVGVLGLCAMLVSVVANRFGTFPGINDYHDIWLYVERGSWVSTGQQPYRDVFSEYPQIATWLFAIPHVVVEAWSWLSGTHPDRQWAYRYVFSGMMAIGLAATITILYELRRDHRWLGFLVLLPASWYFTHNRFDIVPAFLTLVSLFALRRACFRTAFAVLAVAAATKWYPLVIVPVFIMYIIQVNRAVNRPANKRLLLSCMISFGLTVIAIALPDLLAIGWDGFLVPYRFHAARETNPESLLHLIIRLIPSLNTSSGLLHQVIFTGFLLLQFAIVPLCMRAHINTLDNVITWSALSILCFMLFAKFYSPQWILWVIPWLVLWARTPLDVAGIVVFDLTTYAYFPYLYYMQDKHPLWFPGIIAFKTLLLGLWILHILCRNTKANSAHE